jgi:antitoxin component YwqK of YwqJK toxin-antitoxin module
MMKFFLLAIGLLGIYGCSEKGINDKSKRNENWIWWVDQSTGVGKWIPYAASTTVKDGEFTAFYFNGLIYSHGQLKEGNEIDTTFYYDLEGKPNEYINFTPDTFYIFYPVNGKYKAFNQTGTIREKGIVENNKRGNQWIWYYPDGKVSGKKMLVDNTGWKMNYYKSGQIQDSIHYSNDLVDGKAFHWYENGQLQEICDWKMEVQNGEYITYHENGNLKQKVNWKDGNRVGEALVWFSNKQPELKQFWKDGKLEGKEFIYYENGQIKQEFNYKNGLREGKQLQYHSNGKLQASGMAMNAKQEGIWEWYNEDGTPMETDRFRNGELIKTERH